MSVLRGSPYNLAWGSTVKATVVAINAVGSSPASANGGTAVIITTPDPPNPLNNNAVVTSSSVIGMTWVAPAVNGGTPVIDYRVSWDQGGSTFVQLASGITSTAYTTSVTLVANSVYKFKVESRNSFGYSTSSTNEVAITAKTTAAVAPTAPLTLANNAAVTASGTVGLTWLAPLSNGGVPILDYKISAKTGGAAYSTLGTSASTSYTALGLTAGAVYTFKVSARNSVGSGPDSSEVDITAAAIPNVPAAPTTTVNTNVSVTISWVAPSNGGSAITTYSVKIRQSDGSTYTKESANCNVSTTSCTVPISVLQASPYNLVWGSKVFATVSATNAVGSSVDSSASSGITTILTNPDPPSSLANNPAATSLTNIGITWTAPTVNGGTPVIDYRVSWDQGGLTFVVLASNIIATAYVTTATLTANKVYKFKVESRNAFGFSSSFSNEASIKAAAAVVPTAP